MGPEPVRGRHGGSLTGSRTEAEAEGQPDVDDGQDAEPQQQAGDVTVHDPAIDGHADEYGYECLARLMAHAQYRTECDIAALFAHRAPQDGPSRQVCLAHASLRSGIHSAQTPCVQI